MKRRTRLFGLLIGAAGILFVATDVARDWDSVVASVAAANSGYLGAAFLLGAFGMLTIALGWRRCLLALGGQVAIGEALRQYFVGELGKYVPGGVWSVVGRGELARKSGLSRVSSYGATLVSIALAYLAAVATAGLAALIAGPDKDASWLALVWVLPVVFLVLHPRIIRLGIDLISKIGRRPTELEPPSWGTAIGLMFFHIPAWVAIGTATWLVAISFDAVEPELINVLFAAVVSWIAGLLAVPVPGGIGVREAVFVALATSLTTVALAGAVALASRLLFILIDVAGAIVVEILGKKNAQSPL